MSKSDIHVNQMQCSNGSLFCSTNKGVFFVLKHLTLTPLYHFSAHAQRLFSFALVHFDAPSFTSKSSTSDRLSLKDDSMNKRLYNQLKPIELSRTVSVRQQYSLITLGRALSPMHEEMFLSSSRYHLDSLKNYANCLFLCAWDCNEEAFK